MEEAVPVSSLVDGEQCWISNGVRGFIYGKIRLNGSSTQVDMQGRHE
jgi:4-amino-4-deoxychorismate lyase